MPLLGVNIDHVATLREARQGGEPEPVFAALLVEAAGADSIVAHLREDRRHIKERDLYLLKEMIRIKLNMEMSCAEEIVDIACEVKPAQVTLVPEKRQELTTEGGLDAVALAKKIKQALIRLQKHGISASLFIDPDTKQINAAKRIGATMIELHTGRYSSAVAGKEQDKYFQEIAHAARLAKKAGLRVFAGHGLNYQNVARIAKIEEVEELNIGHSIISRAVLVGLERAVREMKALSA